ncbi:MAG: Ig-like domain repeat protein [Silvibacterium sp.]|nr:Ig-like domain repeat protein [Silvibacterium sp.]
MKVRFAFAATLILALFASISSEAQPIISRVAGNGTAGFSGDGLAIEAQLNTPFSIAFDQFGNIFIADAYNHRIRKVDTSGNLTTVAGNGTAGFSGDGGPATSASLNYPFGLAVDSAGNLYIADTLNNRVRIVTPGGTINTLLGDGTTGTGMNQVNHPFGVSIDGPQNLYVADTFNQRVLKRTPAGIVSAVAGNGVAGYNGDGIYATTAQLSNPEEIFTDGFGNLYIADTANARIRKVDTSGIISTVAGNGTAGYNGDGIPATTAELGYPVGVALDTAGNLYIADSNNQRIREVSTTGTISTIAGNGTAGYNGDGIPATFAELNSPTGVAVNGSGIVYLADSQNQTVRAIGLPPMTISPGNPFAFQPPQPMGTTSKPQTFTFTNTGSTTLTLGSLSNSLPQIFLLQSDNCSGQTLVQGASCQFSIAFSALIIGPLPPGVDVPYTGTVTIPTSGTPSSYVLTLNATGLRQATTTALYSDVNPQFAGSKVIFTAIVNPSGGGQPTGSILWQEAPVGGGSAVNLGTTQLANGQATFNTNSFSIGSNIVSASYSGDQNFASSFSTLTQVTQPPLASITTVSGSGQTLSAGGPAFPQPLVAKVLNIFGSPVAGVPVQFSGPGLSFPGAGSVITDSNGRATITAYANSTGSFTARASVAGLTPASFSLKSNTGVSLSPAATFYAIGSSAQFNTFALAATNVNQLCGTNYWTQSNPGGPNAITVTDPRSGLIAPQGGDIWIIWNNQAAAGQPGGIVCYYVAVDSVVAARLYQAKGIVNLPASYIGTADAGLLPYLAGTATPLPAAIQAIVNGSSVNAGLSDIRPEDAKFASNRALTPYGSFMVGRGFTGVGYRGPLATPWLGQPIFSAVSMAGANPVDYAFIPPDVDPVNGALPVRPYRELPIGAAPVLVIANVSQTGSGHLGDGNYTNVNLFSLSNALLGVTPRVRDLAGAPGDGDQPLHVWIDDPLSGAYNVIDFSVSNSAEIAGDVAQAFGRVTGQEAGILPSNNACAGLQPCTVESGNPLYHIFGSSAGGAATRGRVIGTREMISTVNSIPDSLGYAFWSFGNFAGSAASNLKYLTVNGVDPLYSPDNPNPASLGALPQCVSVPCLPPFENVKNGSYPIWSMYRMLYDYTDPTSLATNLANLAQTSASTLYGDFVPASSLHVFRSHFPQVVTSFGDGYTANNGLISGTPETGGDMAGAVLTAQSEHDFIIDTGGNQQTGMKQ